jgi:hypothetical protein
MRPMSPSLASWIVVAVAVVLCSVAAPARLRSIGAGERRGEADLAALMALLLLLRTDGLRWALPGGSGRLGRALPGLLVPARPAADAGAARAGACGARSRGDGGSR